MPNIQNLGLSKHPYEEHTVIADWSMPGYTVETTLDHYYIQWEYQVEGTYLEQQGRWFDGGTSEVTYASATYNYPEYASYVRVKVLPVAKTHQVNGQDTAYWYSEGKWSYPWSTGVTYPPPEKPSAPTLEAIENYQVKASLENVTDGEGIHFIIYNQDKRYTHAYVDLKYGAASFIFDGKLGDTYYAVARAYNKNNSHRDGPRWDDFSEPSEYSEPLQMPPKSPEIQSIIATSTTSLKLTWTSETGAKTYELQYTTNQTYFDETSEVTSITDIENPQYQVTGLETGSAYYFRVRGITEAGDEGAWSEIKQGVLGKAPSAPTTWSSSTTVVSGEDLYLYWVHNAEDGSLERKAEVEITRGGETTTTEYVNEGAYESDGSQNPDFEQTSRYVLLKTGSYTEGTEIKWRVRTCGVTSVYGDWSVMRTVTVYAPPTLTLSVTDKNGEEFDTLTSFPFYISGIPGPASQSPIAYSVEITSQSAYTALDEVGRERYIVPGDAVYSAYIDTADNLLLEMTPASIDLEDGADYTVTATVAMNSGLNATQTEYFGVSWADEIYEVNSQIAIDQESYVAYLTPYCQTVDGTAVENVTMAVYRREYDGTYTSIATGIDPADNTVVVDPHPSLDYARYRIVATSNTTGAINYYDAPGYPVGCDEVVIQWDEEWQDYNVVNDNDITAQPQYTGSMVKIRGNVDISDNNTPEASLVSYIGRRHPVSYYGTQIDTTGSWSMEIPKADTDTLFALRRLAIWQGDVYVREPSGIGYWANVNVSYNRNHNTMTIPITLDITRVEGGI